MLRQTLLMKTWKDFYGIDFPVGGTIKENLDRLYEGIAKGGSYFHIKNCNFENLETTMNSACIYLTGNYNLPCISLIEYSAFTNCKSCFHAGAIYMLNVINVISSACCYGCTSPDSPLFCHISGNKYYKDDYNKVIDSSVVHCKDEGAESYCSVIKLELGLNEVKNVNLSHNKCAGGSIHLNCYDNSKNFAGTISYSSVSHNIGANGANSHGIIEFTDSTIDKCKLEKCNIFKNTFVTSTDNVNAIINLNVDSIFNINDVCILENTGADYQMIIKAEKVIFSNCTVDLEFEKQINIETEFVHILSPYIHRFIHTVSNKCEGIVDIVDLPKRKPAFKVTKNRRRKKRITLIPISLLMIRI